MYAIIAAAAAADVPIGHRQAGADATYVAPAALLYRESRILHTSNAPSATEMRFLQIDVADAAIKYSASRGLFLQLPSFFIRVDKRLTRFLHDLK